MKSSGAKHPNSEQVQDAIDGLIRDKKIIEEPIGSELRLFPTSGAFFEDLKDDGLDRTFLRELIYELESRGLVKLSLREGAWFWVLTSKGRASILSSYDRSIHRAVEEIGLGAISERRYQLNKLFDETGLRLT